MIKVIEICQIKPYEITCLMNNGMYKKLMILPLIENHLHLEGVDRLKNEQIFLDAEIGELGEVRWRNIVKSIDGSTLLDYDISPEFVFHNGINVKLDSVKS